jgi:NTE family protein
MNTHGTTQCHPDLWQISANDSLGLALSGGGFRASLFHIGVLARLAELDLLRQVSVLSTVSGGSIIGAYYYLKIKDLLEGRRGEVSRQAYINIVEEIEVDFLREVQTNIRMQLMLDPLKNVKMLLSDDYSSSDRIAELYNKHFYQPITKSRGIQNIKLSQLKIMPKDVSENEKEEFDVDKYNKNQNNKYKIPILTINATSLNTGHRWEFTSSWVGETPLPDSMIDTNVTLGLLRLDGQYLPDRKWERVAPCKDQEKIRQAKLDELTLSHAVAASACVPGIFTPLSIHDLYWNSRQEEIVVELVDGGVFDNQGLDALFSAGCTHVICSDASGQLDDNRAPSSQILSVASRANDILMTRVRAEGLEKLLAKSPNRKFAFFRLRNAFETQKRNTAYPSIPGPVDRSDDKTDGHIYRLSNLRTDLDTFTDMEAFSLMYDGYCLCDSRLVTHSEALNLGTPVEFPCSNRWKFLNIRRIIGKSDELLEHLRVGANRSFKVFRLAPFSSWLCAALIAVPLIILCWKNFHFLERLYMYFITYGVSLAIPIGAIVLLLKQVENARLVMQLLDKLRKFSTPNCYGSDLSLRGCRRDRNRSGLRLLGKLGGVRSQQHDCSTKPRSTCPPSKKLMPHGDSGGSRVGQGSGATAEAHFQAHRRHRKCEFFPDAFRATRPFDVEIPVEHREQQLHLEQGENAAGTNARTRTKRNVRRYVMRSGLFAEPTPGPEGMGLNEVPRIARRRTREHTYSSSRRHEQITDHCFDFGFEEQDRGYWAQTHRFVGNRAGPDELVCRLDVAGHVRCSEEFGSLSPQFHHRLRAVAQLVDSPAQRVRSRVFAREQHGHEISENHVVGKRPPVVIACRQHGLQKIRRLLGSSGLGREARPLGDDQLAEPSSKLRESAVETTIPRKPDEPPRRKQRKQPAVCCWQHESELALNDVLPLLDGVDVVAEGDERRNVHRETLDLADNIERRAGVRQPFPALFQAGGDGLKLRIKAA